MNAADISDELIVSFLDGVASPADEAKIALAVAEDPALARRVEELAADVDGLRIGMDGLLASAPALDTPVQGAVKQGWRWPHLAAAAAMFAFGLGLAQFLDSGAEPKDWRMAVADYQALYVTQTLTATPATEPQRAEGLAQTGAAIGMDLAPARIAVEGYTFQRAQILAFEGRPLAQLTYLDRAGNPIAFCFTRRQGADLAPEELHLNGLNASAWRSDGVGFIVIGPAPLPDVSAAGRQLAAQFGA